MPSRGSNYSTRVDKVRAEADFRRAAPATSGPAGMRGPSSATDRSLS